MKFKVGQRRGADGGAGERDGAQGVERAWDCNPGLLLWLGMNCNSYFFPLNILLVYWRCLIILKSECLVMSYN